MAEANVSTADRLVHVLDHLDIERAHFAASMLADVIDIARTHPERMASLTLVCPPRLDPSLRALGPRLRVIAGDQGSTAAMVHNSMASLQEATVVWLRDYFSPPWADVVADCTEQVETAIVESLSSEQEKNSRNVHGDVDVRGEIAGITYHLRGAGTPLVLLPLSLAPSQWDPLLARFGAQFYTVALGGPELGFWLCWNRVAIPAGILAS